MAGEQKLRGGGEGGSRKRSCGEDDDRTGVKEEGGGREAGDKRNAVVGKKAIVDRKAVAQK